MDFREACIEVKQQEKDNKAKGLATRVSIVSNGHNFQVIGKLLKVGTVTEMGKVVTAYDSKKKKITGCWSYT